MEISNDSRLHTYHAERIETSYRSMPIYSDKNLMNSWMNQFVRRK